MAVMSQIPRRNGWTIAAQAGDRAPDKTQRLLSRAVWDTVAAMGVVRRFAVAGLDEAAGKAGRRRGLVAAIVDRVTFNAHILETGTQSYRLRTTKTANRSKKPS